ncbi:DUF6517 family protein [Haloarcula onubensis]|uniref:DUF6517 family protein n=1 Tax=Haloarcula onubensis TaxID=2950539 RepID=A0ABU2FQR3_9EURY|nr:DUF6517 family protein [Halomicroarcula sp. S3CR25-11]MDS0283103.1 DUF6517 family protein [Halomicroarcula sp. S3CR25-11]
MTRRRTGVVLAVALALSVAGCSGVLVEEETQFVAGEATVSEAGELSYTHNTTEWQNVTRSVAAAGQEREVTVSNRAELFVNRSADGSPAAAFTVVSSPGITVAGQELSPVAEWSQRDLLDQFAGQFDQYGTVTDVEERETRQVTMLGEEANMRVFNATLEHDNETSHDVIVTVARVKHEGDYVVAIGLRGIGGTDPSAAGDDSEALVRRIEH